MPLESDPGRNLRTTSNIDRNRVTKKDTSKPRLGIKLMRPRFRISQYKIVNFLLELKNNRNCPPTRIDARVELSKLKPRSLYAKLGVEWKKFVSKNGVCPLIDRYMPPKDTNKTTNPIRVNKLDAFA